MCLAVPGRIVEVQGRIAMIDIEGVKRRVDLSLLPEAKKGDHVIVHAGFAIEIYSEEQARESLKLMREMLDAISE